MSVLIAEDDAISRRVLAAILSKWGYRVEIAVDGLQALAILEQPGAPRLAILDWMMPGLTGLEVCHRLRARPRDEYTYVLLLTARNLRDDIIAGMDAGADDYVAKPFDEHELRVRLRAGTRWINLQTELINAREALREQATRDSLTGVWNRSAIMAMLDTEIGRAVRDGKPLGVAMLDLDHFKNINDTFGHCAGDAVLREAARRLQFTIRQYDAIGRYGGEEFLFLLPGCGDQDGQEQAERLRAALAGERIDVSDDSITVTASIGCSSMEPDRPAPAELLIRRADEALYRAKALGRNRVEISANASVAPAPEFSYSPEPFLAT